MEIDDEGMAMPHSLVAVRMEVRLGTLPPFVLVLMMFIVDMKVSVVETLVSVVEFTTPRGGPDAPGRPHRYCSKRRENDECRGHPQADREPPGERISQEPTGVRERKLSREERWAVGRMAGCA